ncbi:sirohydrochlorin cobaltochelatase [Propionibacterium cyclohexanicum]|uniref:precorrin-2 dehydrogenase n=1 Tax=Propionibacterium cyclohexanicum TaxID=64702 RepID=A0A1H9QCB5_9ACTN|nr:CbiX/SirB N-terminal domain-containing protein [Propionibacterium cyclohexanicum]SER58060.1 sirohydrochlorin cobaltochelatase [Propionibacterium cyclohexanicum]
MPEPRTPLVIAGHGTRDAQGLAQCRALVEKVAGALPGVHVALGFVEIVEPDIATALAQVLDRAPDPGPDGPEAVVVPLLLNTGGHIRRDIPGAVERGRGEHRVAYAGPLLPDPRVRTVLERRIARALEPDDGPAWRAADTSVVLVGRGALDTDANSNHYRLSRQVWEEMGLEQVLPSFIQVVRPSVPQSLTAAADSGAQQILVAPNFLFAGRLRTWLHEQVAAWSASHPGVQVRVAEVLGPAGEIAEILIDRYREQLGTVGEGQGAPVYLSGLRLQGRDVLVVGAGRIAERRIPKLLAAGAQVRVVAPSAGIRVAQLAQQGLVDWQQRAASPRDVAGAWYVLAASNDPQVNEEIAQAAEASHIFCVRCDKAVAGSAFTPATQAGGGLTVAVVGNRDPRRSVRIRDELLRLLQS